MEADGRPEGEQIDPIWTTSRTSRQIYALGEVEKVLLSSLFLNTIPESLKLSAGHWAAARPGSDVHFSPHLATDRPTGEHTTSRRGAV